MSDDQKKFGQFVREQRFLRGLTQKDAAKKTRISPSYLSGLENGEPIAPPREVCERIVKALDLTRVEAKQLHQLAALSRGTTEYEETLPAEVRQLIALIRKRGEALPEKFVKHLATLIREAAA